MVRPSTAYTLLTIKSNPKSYANQKIPIRERIPKINQTATPNRIIPNILFLYFLPSLIIYTSITITYKGFNKTLIIDRLLIIEMEENIDTHTFLTITKDKVIIKKDYTREYDDIYRMLFIIYGIFSALFLILSIFSISFLFTFIIISFGFLPYIGIYTYYRYRKLEWIFDKMSNKIRLQRVSPSFKRNRAYDFSNIDLISYQERSNWGPPIYGLMFYFKNKKRGKRFYTGEKIKCERLGSLISEFIEKFCIYNDLKEGTTYWDYYTDVLQNTKTALKEDAKIEGNVIFIDIRHRKKFIIDKPFVLRKAREKCPYSVLRFFAHNNEEHMIITSRSDKNLAKRFGLTSRQTHRIRLLNPKLPDNQIVDLLK